MVHPLFQQRNFGIRAILAILPKPVKASIVFIIKVFGIAFIVILILVLWVFTVAFVTAAAVAFATWVWVTAGGASVVIATMLVALAGRFLVWFWGYVLAKSTALVLFIIG